ncbi:MAG: acyl-CoA/acyl-ACP dehydrogenase [Tatlockia sp.]|nr:acyl-CoA/acyl-ACP dehydrogenase [Tatlockia sp.]
MRGCDEIDQTVDESSFLRASHRFVQEQIAPFANQFALEAKLPLDLIIKIASQDMLGTLINKEYGGLGLSYTSYGKLTRMVGKACSSIRSLLTVHDMVAEAIQGFGNESQKRAWLPQLAAGKIIAAFALTEPDLGSSIDKIQTILIKKSDYYLRGNKVWVSFGQVADVLLVFAKLNGEHPVAILVPTDSPNISIKPIQNALGKSASMLAEICFDDVLVKEEQFIGSPGIGLSFVATRSLTLGRYSVSCGCLGIIDACISLVQKKVQRSRPDGSRLIDFQLISAMISDMLANRKIVSLLCKNAGTKMEQNFLDALEDVMIAKYVSARLASQTANDTLQIYGAEGYHENSPIRRFIHDAKVCELIEGSNEIMRLLIGKSFLGNYE